MSFKLKSNSTIFQNKYDTINDSKLLSEFSQNKNEFTTYKQSNINKPEIMESIIEVNDCRKLQIESSTKPTSFKESIYNSAKQFLNNMSFSNINGYEKNSIIQENTKKENLLEKSGIDSKSQTFNENAALLLNKLNGLIFDFNKIYDGIISYRNILISPGLTNTELLIIQKDAKIIINRLPTIINDIKSNISSIESIVSNIPEISLKVKFTDYKKLLNNKILPKKEELNRVIEEIIDKEKEKIKYNHNKNDNCHSQIEMDDTVVQICKKHESFNKNFDPSKDDRSKNRSICTLSYELDNQEINNVETQILGDKSVSKTIDFSSFNQLEMKDNLENETTIKDLTLKNKLIEEREKELNHVHKISAQIKEMSNYLNQKTHEQGKLLSKCNYFL
jgi:hypothetical protein